MTILTSMGAHKLEVLKGSRNDIVDYTGVLDTTAASVAAAIAGRVMSLTAGGLLVSGLAVAKIPYFAWSGTDSNNAPDVTRDRGMPYSGQVRFGTISAFAAVELSTTEFVAGTYTPGDPLTALSTTATTQADRGLLKVATVATDPIVGYVSATGKYTSPDGYSTLAFYPKYVPGTTISLS